MLSYAAKNASSLKKLFDLNASDGLLYCAVIAEGLRDSVLIVAAKRKTYVIKDGCVYASEEHVHDREELKSSTVYKRPGKQNRYKAPRQR